jgi:hypothetical protein
MRHRSIRVVALMAAASLLGVPAQAQDGTRDVSLDGMGFTFDASIGTSVDVRQVPGQRPADVEGTPETADAPHLAYLVYGRRPEDARVRQGRRAPVLVRMYPTAEMAGFAAADQMEQLSSILTERPDLSSFMTIGVEGGGDLLPYLPVGPAPRALQARAAYVDAPEVSGVEYVTAFSFDASPFAATDFWYTFQGLSADGAWYVAVDAIIDASMFPDEVTAQDARETSDARRYARYLTESQATLDTADPSAFDPSLTSLQALVQSLTFGGGDALPAPDGSPVPEAAESPAPSPSPDAS